SRARGGDGRGGGGAGRGARGGPAPPAETAPTAAYPADGVPVASPKRRGPGPLVVAGAIVAGLLLAAAGVIFVKTDKGTLAIETDDADVRAERQGNYGPRQKDGPGSEAAFGRIHTPAGRGEQGRSDRQGRDQAK